MRLDLLSAVLFVTFHGINGATVKLGKTTLTGTNITSLGQEFFAGQSYNRLSDMCQN
jgi:hypothetical protein